LDDLSGLGFQVGDCQSAYPVTDYSLAWTLNPDAATLPDGMLLWKMIRESEVRTALEQRGYQTVAFATGFVWTEFMDAAVYYQPPILSGDLNIFEIYYLQQTPLNLFLRKYFDMDALLSQIYRERTLTLLDHLPDASAMDGPQFVFAHIVQPHPPFVFDANGNPANWREYTLPGDDYNPAMRTGYSADGYAAGYVVEVQYIEGAILPRLAAIVAADPNSIIILAGDHGPWFSETKQDAQAILCAVRGFDLPLNTRLAFKELIK
jgi:phosphoglycerol transferase MdoB-like AlkP superfamily enzyme